MVTNETFYYEATPRNRNELREIARNIRLLIGAQNILCFPIVKFLEFVMPYKFGVWSKTVSDTEWQQKYNKNVHASFNLDDMTIEIKESVYLGAIQGKGRDRMTIAHEIAHALLLSKDTIKLYRSMTGGRPVPFKDPEWQAKCLAGELLIDYDLCHKMSKTEIVHYCQVSEIAASVQLNAFSKIA